MKLPAVVKIGSVIAAPTVLGWDLVRQLALGRMPWHDIRLVLAGVALILGPLILLMLHKPGAK